MKIQAFAFVLLGMAASLPAAAERRFEKTIPVPRHRDARLDWTSDRCSVLSVIVRNYPNEDDIAKARHEDPNDHSWLWWEFNVENRGDRKCRIKLWVEIYDRNGKVVKSGDRSDTVDAHKLDDDIRVSTRLKTLEIVDAPKVRVSAEIGPK